MIAIVAMLPTARTLAPLHGPPVRKLSSCTAPKLSTSKWRMARSPRMPSVQFLLPESFVREPGEDTYALKPTPRGSRWSASDRSQISVFVSDSSGRLFTHLPQPDSVRPEYSRCEEMIKGAHATIVSYNKLEEVGDMAYIGPYQIFAELRSPEGVVVQVATSATTHLRHEELLRAIRTVRIGAK